MPVKKVTQGSSGDVKRIMVPEGYIVTKQRITSNAARQS
jgi:hypothetical protein